MASVLNPCLTSTSQYRIGSLGSGGMTNANPGGWRYIFYTQACFHGLTSIGLFAFYWPPKNIEYPKM